MTERYRKWGRVVRLERDSLISADEAGEAIEDGELFTARPLGENVDLQLPVGDVEAFASEVRACVPESVELERLIVSAGVADHEFGSVRWRERTARAHVALVNRSRRLRVTLDLGAESCAGIALRDVRVVGEGLARVSTHAAAPPLMVIAPYAASAMLPMLVNVEGITLIQSAGGRDGKGARIEERVISDAPFPNWFRPSYRVRPVRLPFHLRADATAAAADWPVPRVIAITGVRGHCDFDVLCDDGERVFETVIAIDRVRAVGPPAGWYPHGAGVFGSELLL